MEEETWKFLKLLSQLKRHQYLESLGQYAEMVRSGINPLNGSSLNGSIESDMIRSAVTYNPNQMEFDYAF